MIIELELIFEYKNKEQGGRAPAMMESVYP